MFTVQIAPTDAVTIIYSRPYCTIHRFLSSGIFHLNQNNSYVGLMCSSYFIIVICSPVAGQRLGKHSPAATNTQATIG
jgi:hypothetical protein